MLEACRYASDVLIVILMGAAGAGKTTVGRALARARGWTFHDADDLHPSSNIEKIADGTPLSDADRAPWLARVHDLIVMLSAGHLNAVVGCSALRASYRRTIADDVPGVRWVYLKASPDLLRRRLALRRGHFAGPEILDDQLRTLEEPADALVLDAARPVDDLVREISVALAA